MRSVSVCFALILLFALSAQAQIPKVSLYADPVGVTCNIVDQSPGVLRMYVVVTDAPGTVTAVRFAAPVPECMTGVSWSSDELVFPISIGNSQEGITVGVPYCAETPLHVLTINYVGQGLSQTCCHYPVLPDPSELEGEIIVVDCDYEMVIGGTLDLIVNGDVSCPCGQHPTPPSDPSPPDGAEDQPTDLVLTWNCSDPQEQPLSYFIYFGTTTPPPLVASNHPTNSYAVSSLQNSMDYFWRIVARDSDGNQTSGPEWRFGTAVGIEQRPDPPSNPSPAVASTGQSLTVTLSWECSDPQGDPLTYDIFFGDATMPLIAADHPTNSYEVTSLSQDKLYHWRIRAKDNQGHDRWGDIWWFTTLDERPDFPHDPSPANFSTVHTQNVTLMWQCSDPQGDPLTYDVYFGTTSTPPLVATDRTANSYDVGPLNWNYTYYWRIVARDDQGNEKSGSLWWFVVLAEGSNAPLQPSNPRPPHRATDQPLNVTLMWDCSDPDGDPLTYDVYFGTTSTPPLVAADRATNSYDVGPLDWNHTYQWRIVAKDDHGHKTSSSLWWFSVASGAGAPLQPSNPRPSWGAEGQPLNVTLMWDCSDPDGDPLTYDVYFGPNFPPPLVESDHTANSFSVGPLLDETKYRWRIVAKDGSGNATSSSPWYFVTARIRPYRPTNLSPPDKAVGQSLAPRLAWQCTHPSGLPMTYDIYFGTVNPPPRLTVAWPNNSFNVGPLSPQTKYYWRIRALDAAGYWAWGDLWDFTTLDAPVGTPWAPNPPTGAVNQPLSLTLTWQCSASGGDTFTYDIYFGTSSEPPLAASDRATNHYTVGPLDAATVYYWKIVARDQQSNEKSGPLWMFQTQGLGPPRVVVNTVTDYCALDSGPNVTVTVSLINNASAIDAAGVDVTYDPSVLTFQSCVPGDLTSGWQQFGHTDQGTSVRIGGYDVAPIPQGSAGTFAVLTFVSDCCNLPEPASFQMCPVNMTDDLSSMAPACGSYTCDFVTFTQDGDVNWDGETTPADAFCAFQGYLSPPDEPDGECGAPGWSIRADVDCSEDVTPADATCIYDHWLDGSCAFCGGGLALAANRPSSAMSPVVSVGTLADEGDEIALPIHASGIFGMQAFGFEMTYPASLEYIGIVKTSDTEGFMALDARVIGSGHLRAGGFSHDPMAGDDADIVVLRFRKTSASAGGTLVIQEFVDGLQGAATVRYTLPSGESESSPLTEYRLYQNQPNPFNPTTTIRYDIPAGAASVRVRLDIYDVQGHKVRVLADEIQSPGAQYTEWDGLDDNGRAVSSGMYFYVLRAGDASFTKKMALLK